VAMWPSCNHLLFSLRFLPRDVRLKKKKGGGREGGGRGRANSTAAFLSLLARSSGPEGEEVGRLCYFAAVRDRTKGEGKKGVFIPTIRG